MKSSLMIIIILCLGATDLVFSQLDKSFEIDGNLLVPTGSLKNKQDLGFEVGGMGFISTGNPIITIAIGAGYLVLPGKDIMRKRGNMIITSYGADFKPFKVFIGPYFGNNKGFFLLPAINANFEHDWSHVGIDVAAGYLFTAGKLGISVKGKFSMLNPLRKEGEKDKNLASFGVGILF